MSKGLLAEWRRSVVGRGLTAAALLAVPVAVAAAIGFQGSLSGLTQGLDSLATEPQDAQAGGPGPDEIDTAIAAIAVGTSSDSAPGGGQGGGGQGGGGGGEVPGGGDTPPGGGAPGDDGGNGGG